jgi:hypothetical protein
MPEGPAVFDLLPISTTNQNKKLLCELCAFSECNERAVNYLL